LRDHEKSLVRSATLEFYVGSVGGDSSFFPCRPHDTVRPVYSERMANRSFVVECPCCRAKLTIDAELAAVVGPEEPPRQGSTGDLGSAFDQLRAKSAEREERFKQQMQAEAQ